MNEHSSLPKAGAATLALAALGVVYGDIGTSPLYAFKEAFAGPHGLVVTAAHAKATLSALFWAVMLIVSFKYVAIVLRHDNEGEGGVLALTALAHRLAGGRGRAATWLIGAGIFAAALFYGDAIITPAISVLSAVEGIGVATPAFGKYVVPLTVLIISGLFLIQRFGTGKVGVLFGPVMVLWFAVLGTLGVMSIARTPEVLEALNPLLAFDFAVQKPHAAFMLLSAVFLALTGGEALYADMGHFGAKPIRMAWYGLACPALMLNYFGQGALVIRTPAAGSNPFYLLAPEWFQLPLVVLATAATVIASQATISGAFSMTLQASRLGYLPRVRILHTSDTERGQIYVPTVNWMMLVAVIWLVLEFRSSSGLAAAYGIAVSGTMMITTVLTAYVTLTLKGRFRLPVLLSLLGLLVLESFFLASNLTKIGDGGWLPLCLGLALYVMLTTWKEGTSRVSLQRKAIDIPLADFVAQPPIDVPRVAGTAVYLTSDPSVVPSALFHTLKHFKSMHERLVFLNVVNEEVPWVPEANRVSVTDSGSNIFQVVMRFGFREEPDVPRALEAHRAVLPEMDPMLTTFVIARSTIVDGPGELPSWRSGLFGWMTRQAESAVSYFRLPANRVVELGTQVML